MPSSLQFWDYNLKYLNNKEAVLFIRHSLLALSECQ